MAFVWAEDGGIHPDLYYLEWRQNNARHMRIQFCGAARQVTGSAHLISLDDGFRILLDCGLFQGYGDDVEENNRNWYFNPRDVDCVILSHAHIDHSGRLPKLVRDGFGGPIHSTHATRSLCSIMLLDSAYIQEKDAEYHNKRQRRKYGKDARLQEPLYVKGDVKETMRRFAGYPYDRWFSIHERVDVLFRDAGHILGSATVTLRIRENGKTTFLGFTGDVGRPERPILRDPAPMPELDYLICESTYGDREHSSAPEDREQLLKIVKETCVEGKGKLLIPAFSVGRTQEIVYMLDKLETEGRLPKMPVFVDSPLAVNATMIFGAHPECFDDDLNEYMLIDHNPFGFNNLHYVRHASESKQLNDFKEPCIIISAAGMMNAGRIRHHTFNNIEKKNTTLLIVGYCAPETPCGRIREGIDRLRIFGQEKKVKARVEIMDSFSAHADRRELLDFVNNQQPHLRQMFLVHGDYDRQQALGELLRQNGFPEVEMPYMGQQFVLEKD